MLFLLLPSDHSSVKSKSDGGLINIMTLTYVVPFIIQRIVVQTTTTVKKKSAGIVVCAQEPGCAFN